MPWSDSQFGVPLVISGIKICCWTKIGNGTAVVSFIRHPGCLLSSNAPQRFLVAVEVKALFCEANSRNMSHLKKIRRNDALSARESMTRSLRCGRHQGRHRRSSSPCRLLANVCDPRKLQCRGAAASSNTSKHGADTMQAPGNQEVPLNLAPTRTVLTF